MNAFAIKVQQLVDHLAVRFPEREAPVWAEGWPDEIEAALLDAVFSARATYGGERSGVRAVIARWRAHHGGQDLDDLHRLARYCDSPHSLIAILGNRQRVPGNYTTKAEAAARAARALVEVGAGASDQLLPEHRDVLTSIPGLGSRTWELFSASLGALDGNAIDRITAFVAEAVTSEAVSESGSTAASVATVNAATASELLCAAAPALHTTVRTLVHAILRLPAPERKKPGSILARRT